MSDGVKGSGERVGEKGMVGHKRNAATYSVVKGSHMEKTFELKYLRKMKEDER